MSPHHRNNEPHPQYRFLIVRHGEKSKTIDCVCRSPFAAPVPQDRIPSQVSCGNCSQRFVLQWIDLDRTRPGSEVPSTSEGHLVAVDADGQFRSVQWSGRLWFAQGKEQQVYRWFELNRPAHAVRS